MNKIQILKVIVGSQAHGLATPTSDFDYRGVFVIPTTELLKLGNPIKTTSWIEGNDDDTSWEIGHFLNMATHCNPTILETFLAPVTWHENPVIDKAYYDAWGQELRALFPHVWNSRDVMNAFIGYGVNQRKKFFDNKDERAPKYAAAYLRVLYNAYQLLSTGTFDVDLRESPIYEIVKRFKNGVYTPGEVIEECFKWETEVLKAYKANPDKETNTEPVNEFLLKVRKEFWDA